MTGRRPDGALEAEVLAVLWDAAQPLTPAEVLTALDRPLAYTTVMTILARLWRKGILRRMTRGRGYEYEAAVSEGDLASRRIRDTLRGSNDRSSVLAAFVGSLSRRDRVELRRLLAELDAGEP